MINYTVMLKKSTFGETSNKFIKGSPIQWYTSQEGEEWHQKKKNVKMFLPNQRSITKYQAQKNDRACPNI